MDKLSAIGEPRPADPGARPLKKRSRRPTPWKQRWPDLEIEQILAWADSFYARHGEWPRVRSGPIEDAPGETRGGVQVALQKGNRGLPGGSSLALLIRQRRGQ